MLDTTPMLGVALAPLIPRCGGQVDRAVEAAARLGVRSLQLSAAQKGLRPRELDRRARRELLGLLARQGVTLSGLDLLIPHKDYLQGPSQDRAMAATLAAIELAADLGRVPLCLSLPVDRIDDELIDAMLTAADATGVTLAIHAEHDPAALAKLLDRFDQKVLCAALDPASIIAGGGDAAHEAVALAERLAVARLDDFALASGAAAGGRQPVGRGELDLTAYRAALATARRLRSIVVDARGLPDPFAAVAVALTCWQPRYNSE